MMTAQTLIDGLSGERTRWTAANKRFESQIHKLVGDVLVTTGFLSYAGPFNQEFRKFLMKQWKKEMSQNLIPFSDVSFLLFVAFPVQSCLFPSFPRRIWKFGPSCSTRNFDDKIIRFMARPGLSYLVRSAHVGRPDPAQGLDLCFNLSFKMQTVNKYLAAVNINI